MKERLDRYLLELRVVFEGLDFPAYDALATEIFERRRLYVAGLGRTGLIMRAFATRLTQMGCLTHVALEPGTPNFEDHDLLLIGSGSGATETMVAVAQESIRRGCDVVALTANALSPLARIASRSCLIPPLLPPEHAEEASLSDPVQAIFEQALLLVTDAMAEAIASLRNRP